MMFLILLLCLIFFGGALFLVTQNGTPVDVQFGMTTYRQVPLAVVMVISMVGGVAVATLIGFLDGLRLRFQNGRLRHQVERLEEEIGRVRDPRDIAATTPGTGISSPPDPPLDYPQS
jgi:uncharacterized integral membrane protein